MKRVIKAASSNDNVYYWNGVDEVPQDVVSVIIDDGVTEIRTEAFEDRVNLERIVIPDSVTSIGDYAFKDCELLKFVDFPSTVRYFGILVFSGCSNLQSVVIPEGATYLSYGMFEFSGVTNISIPNSVTKINAYAFRHCHNLVSLNLPDSLQEIHHSAFISCYSLESIRIPEGVKYIKQQTFWECSSLKNVEIPEGVKYIGNHSFYSCTQLNNVVIPKSVQIIEEDAFRDCKNLTDLQILNSHITIGKNAFVNTPIAEQVRKFKNKHSRAAITENKILKLLKSKGIDTTLRKYEVVFCSNRGFEHLWEAESLIATWPGDFLAAWAVAHAYDINDDNPIDIIMENYETVEEFEDVVLKVKDMSGDDMLSYYGDADKDFVVSLTNLDTGKVLIDNETLYEDMLENEPDTFVNW